MGIKEIIEAKRLKALEEAAAAQEPTTSQEITKADVATPAWLQATAVAESVKAEPAPIATAKPLSFAEKMALKKQQQETEQKVEAPKAQTNLNTQAVQVVEQSVEKPATIPASVDITTTPVDNRPASTEEIVGLAIAIDQAIDPNVEQAYADIKDRIDRLEGLGDTELEGQMKELKKALMQNPAAVSLMLDTDIGKMVIALRRITKEAIIEAAIEKKPGRKAKADKAMPVDADAIAAVFDEL